MITNVAHYRRLALLCTTVLGSLAMPAFAQAQEAPPADQPVQEGGDIVVTATRRSESISRVAVSVVAATQEKLDQQGVKNIDALARLTPGVQFTRGSGVASGGTSNIAIRGISSSVGAATTGIYIDDTPIQVRTVLNASGNAYPKVFDLERVEVLRGPQGTLFGAGAEGGTVRFLTPAPSLDKTSVYARSELAFTDGGAPSYEAGVAYGAPIVEGVLGLRVSGWYRRDGGWIDRIDGDTGASRDKNSNKSDSYVMRAALGWQLSDAVLVTPSIYYQKTHDFDRSQYWESYSDPAAGKFRTGNAFSQPTRDRFVLPSLKIEAELGGVSLTSNTSYFDRTYSSRYDYSNFNSALFTPSAYPFLDGIADFAANRTRQKNWTQEVRLQNSDDGRFNWVIGAFYARNKQYVEQLTSNARLDEVLGAQVPGLTTEAVFGVPLLGGVYELTQQNWTTDKQLAGFGEVSYEVVDGLKVIAGLRVSKTKFSFTAISDGPVNGGYTIDSGKQNETPVTPKFGLSYQADANNFFYGTVSKGFRIGGAQSPITTDLCSADLASLGLSGTPAAYGSDSVWSYEVGAKNNIGGGLLRLDSSAYWIDWSNIQQRIAMSGCGFSFIGNLGSATSKGFDLSAQLHPMRGLDLTAQFSYNHTAFTETISNATGFLTRDGQRFGGAPVTVVLAGQYSFPAFGDEAFVRADYQHQSKGPNPDALIYGYDATIPRTPATDFVSLRAGARLNGVDVSVFVDNLTNAHEGLYRSHDTASSDLYYNTSFRPRTAGLTISYRY
jgi:iron complex outermembrane receptor protein